MTEKKTILLDELIATRFSKVEQKEIQMMADKLLQKIRLTEQKQAKIKMKKLKRRSFAKMYCRN